MVTAGLLAIYGFLRSRPLREVRRRAAVFRVPLGSRRSARDTLGCLAAISLWAATSAVSRLRVD
jgi:hypothetical protein